MNEAFADTWNVTSSAGVHSNFATPRSHSVSGPGHSQQRFDGPSLIAPTVLVTNRDPATRGTLVRCLATAGYNVLETGGLEEALGTPSGQVSVIFLDVSDAAPGAAVSGVRQAMRDAQWILVAAPHQTRDALQAVKDGALDFLATPLDLEELLIRTRQAVRIGKLARENRQLRESATSSSQGAELVGISAVTTALRTQLETLATTDSTVLLTGQHGSGKTTLAHWIHRHGARSAQPLVTVHCECLPGDLLEFELFGQERLASAAAGGERPGRIELAHGGTLLLEEVAAVPLEVQGRLVHFLRERNLQPLSGSAGRRINVRVLATTRQDLARLCRQGLFRGELHEQLCAARVCVPPLHARADDIPMLAAEILRRVCRRRGRSVPVLSGDAIAALLEHPWPGNLRELETVLARAATVASDSIHASDLFLKRSAAPDLPGEGFTGLAGLPLSEIERRAILETLAACGGNKAKTARQLGVSEKTIYNKMKQYHLDRAE